MFPRFVRDWWLGVQERNDVKIEPVPTAMVCVGLVMVIVGLLILWV